MAAYIGLKPHMDVVTHYTTVAGDFAMTRSQWLIKEVDKDGHPTQVHHHGMEVHRQLPDGTWVFFMDHPSGADPDLGNRRPAAHRITLGRTAAVRHWAWRERLAWSVAGLALVTVATLVVALRRMDVTEACGAPRHALTLTPEGASGSATSVP
jgi:hypothetical protein